LTEPIEGPDQPALPGRLTAEFVGTALLLAGVVGSGIMAERLTADVGLQLLQNALATAGVLLALILAFGPASGAHFNPAVTLAERLQGRITTGAAVAYVGVQVGGAITGTILANLMFDLDPATWSTKDRSSPSLWLAEVVATFGLVAIIAGVVRGGQAASAPYAVAGYIAGAYYFTSSTSFANPAVTLARTLSDTFAGIAPASVPPFLAAQVLGAVLGAAVMTVVYPVSDNSHEQGRE
jgi:arsenate reductase